MNGIEKITGRIAAETKAETDRLLAAAEAEAAEIAGKYRAQAEREAADARAKNEKAAAEREERLVSVAQMEARRELLAERQTQVENAFARALETLRVGKTAAFLRGALVPGGTVGEAGLLTAAENGGAGLAELYGSTELAAAAQAGADALGGGPLTEFEKLCDDAVSGYLAGAGLIAFGEAPLVSYLAAREREYTNVRILLMGRAAKLAPEVIRARLRT